MILKRIARALWRKMNPPITSEQRTQQIVDQIRRGGGSVGENFHVYESQIDMTNPYLISIGDDVTITGARILTHDASLMKRIGYSKVGKVVIGNNVFVSKDVVILPDTTIGDDVVIGAGAIIAKNIPSDSVVVGNPPRILCSYHEYLEKNKKLMEERPVLNLSPEQILEDETAKAKLIEAGNGFIL